MLSHLIKDVETCNKDDIKEDGEEGLGLEIRNAMHKQSWHASFNIPLYDLTFYVNNKIFWERFCILSWSGIVSIKVVLMHSVWVIFYVWILNVINFKDQNSN